MSLKVAFITLGCKVNQFETASMQEQLVKRGFKAVPFNQPADVYIINTCTVTSRSDLQSRRLIRQAMRKNRLAYIVVTGCYAQVEYKRIQEIEGVDLILGNNEKANLLNYLNNLEKRLSPKTIVTNIANNDSLTQISGFLDYTRAFIKIQDGCNNACSYCIVPRARGKSRSQSIASIKQQVETLTNNDYKEIALTGIHIGTYGHDLSNPTSLSKLLKELIQINNLGRILLSSIEPTEFTEELIDVLQSDKICPHLHIPLQSAHIGQLASMNRRYLPLQYQNLINRLIETLPDLGLGCDIIVGYPGETKEIFEHNYRFLEELPLSYMHVFRFSPRSETKAAGLPDQVSGQAKIERSMALRTLSKQKKLAFKKRYLGKARPTLIIDKKDKNTGRLIGLTDNYINILIPNNEQYVNEIKNVQIVKIDGENALGEVVVG